MASQRQRRQRWQRMCTYSHLTCYFSQTWWRIGSGGGGSSTAATLVHFVWGKWENEKILMHLRTLHYNTKKILVCLFSFFLLRSFVRFAKIQSHRPFVCVFGKVVAWQMCASVFAQDNWNEFASEGVYAVRLCAYSVAAAAAAAVAILGKTRLRRRRWKNGRDFEWMRWWWVAIGADVPFRATKISKIWRIFCVSRTTISNGMSVCTSLSAAPKTQECTWWASFPSLSLSSFSDLPLARASPQ